MAQQTPLYGGDEISAVVLDPGSYYTRVGFAGEDSPKVVVPTTYGYKEDPEVLENDDNSAKNNYYFGDMAIHVPREGMEIANPMEDGIVKDWDAATKLFEYGLTDQLNCHNLEEHPLLMTEQVWNTDENRAKAMEIMFEQFNVPAFYIVKSPVCSLFASGKGSGLVVDLGAEVTTVTPVVDGLTLFKTSRRTKLAGNHLNQHIRDMFSHEIVPRYLIQSKERVELDQPAVYKPKSFAYTLSDSFHRFEQDRVVEEFKECCVLAEEPDENTSECVFEFPDGYNCSFSAKQRFQVSDCLFKSEETNEAKANGKENGSDKDKKKKENDDTIEDGSSTTASTSKSEVEALTLTDRTTNPFEKTGVSDLIVKCINSCDVDIRANLANNIVITGGSSLVQGLNQRINQDLTQELAGLKVRIHAPGNSIERKNSAWIGGSILASLGTFHQLWISQKEYHEVGPSKLLEKRFR